MDRRTVTNIGLSADLIITNLPMEGLQHVLRALITSYPEMIPHLMGEVTLYLRKAAQIDEGTMGVAIGSQEHVVETQKVAKIFVSCGLVLDGLKVLTQALESRSPELAGCLDEKGQVALESLDNDIAQALSVILSERMNTDKSEVIKGLKAAFRLFEGQYSFERSQLILTLDRPDLSSVSGSHDSKTSLKRLLEYEGNIEFFQIEKVNIPRVMCGLWQLSSSAWGSASLSQIMEGFDSHVQHGFTAFDMADIYGDAEIIYGEFRSRLGNPGYLFTATKYCTFNKAEDVYVQVENFISRTLKRLRATSIDLLQLHWRNYTDDRYLDVLRVLRDSTQVQYLGLCNFDALHMETVLRENIDVKTNQVQFSLIDTRAQVGIASICEKYNVKVLAYGVLCGGFLSETWHRQPEPDIFSETINPSQRKVGCITQDRTNP
ncbi:hypothetical protein E8E13_001063 [Curvularia kusanoi]|uniref:NADP-dependent oxidoreductase domain-containing protein n=1 Tax=Curvularia kusanoi TaxID=90978 RepID=A0A9P4W753_CURKU|nr:hypothetical protein E8E13_001063 [Curvularia kusanoi]